MATEPAVGTVTFAEFLETVREDQKADLIDGVIYYMSSPDNTEHDDLVGWFVTVLRIFLRRTGLGKLTGSRVAYRLGERQGPEPDIGIVLTQRVGLVKRGYVDGPPDLAIEVVSSESIKRDYRLKRRQYENAGIREYWIIDPDEQLVTFLVRGATGFVEESLTGNLLRSRVLPGFELDVRQLWQRPLPDEMEFVTALLARRA